MSQPLHIKDEYAESKIYPGQCFDIVFWGAESLRAFGRLSEINTVEIYTLGDHIFEKRDICTDDFLRNAGFNYCDMVILHIYPQAKTIEEVKFEVMNER